MCCLKNEEETYEDLNKRLPGVGDIVTDTLGEDGVVSEVNVLRQRVKVIFEIDDEKEMREYPAEELTIKQKRRKGQNQQKKAKEEMDELPPELRDPEQKENNENRKKNKRNRNKNKQRTEREEKHEEG